MFSKRSYAVAISVGLPIVFIALAPWHQIVKPLMHWFSQPASFAIAFSPCLAMLMGFLPMTARFDLEKDLLLIDKQLGAPKLIGSDFAALFYVNLGLIGSIAFLAEGSWLLLTEWLDLNEESNRASRIAGIGIGVLYAATYLHLFGKFVRNGFNRLRQTKAQRFP